ncbi:hypothetical protein C8Q79DRAFT_89577 [Trametes meyenii]|nr:hypothetical protein C8Q79DRAFT_89577 [Trametes meyenii]
MAEPCQVCFTPSNQVCSACKAVRYCSPVHSVSDWKRHKRECPVLATGIDNQTGYPLKVKVAYFPAAGGEARRVDIPYKLVHDPCTPHIPIHQLDVSFILGEATLSRTRIQIDGFHSGAALGHQLLLIHNDNSISENKPLNMCIQEIHQGSGYGWRDNLFAVRLVDDESRSMQYQDVTEADLRAVWNYFRQGGNGYAALEPENAREELAMYKEMGFQFVSV